MITINLSDEQAKSMLNSLYFRFVCDGVDSLTIDGNVAKELFTQLEHKIMPASTSAAELSAWRYDQGLVEMDIEKWKRKNETPED
ncbi:hypothetical protein CSP48_004031 [Salmonella enterica subsp. arizonae]|nr:hypothetical protein [Salmonella enterica subsp. arizonae]